MLSTHCTYTVSYATIGNMEFLHDPLVHPTGACLWVLYAGDVKHILVVTSQPFVILGWTEGAIERCPRFGGFNQNTLRLGRITLTNKYPSSEQLGKQSMMGYQ